MPSPRPRSTRQAQAAMTYAFGDVARANPVVAAYRWRYELTAIAGLLAAWATLGMIGCAVITAAFAAAIGVAACSPGGRRILRTRFWCVVTQHRVRVGCGQAWIHSRNGKIPAVLLTRSRPFGERVYLWCRAGTSAYDFSSARELLAAACWAQDIQATRHPRYAHLVVLDVIRRGVPAVAAAPAPVPTEEDATWESVTKAA